jgi:hypothetical protein
MGYFSSAVVDTGVAAFNFTGSVIRHHNKMASSLLVKAAALLVLYPPVAEAVVTVCKNYACDSKALHGHTNTMGSQAYENNFCLMLKNSGVECWERDMPDAYSLHNGV